jgi:hypothetical protein
MPSNALQQWTTARMPRLAEVDAQCAATLALTPVPDLADENLRGYVMLLAAHFQGFCRDLHTECGQVFAQSAALHLRLVIQVQCRAARDLDGANAKLESIRKDFDRFGMDLGAELRRDPANGPRVTLLGHLNAWRNYAAHHKDVPPAAGGPFTLAAVRGWKTACDALAAELDRIMYNQLRATLGVPPW